MKGKRLHFLAATLLFATTLLTACGGQPAATNSASSKEPAKEPAKKQAVNFPTKPIKMVVPFAAGGGTDITARAIAEVAGKYLPNGQTIVVENKVGGSGSNGVNEVVREKADGYVITLTTNGPVVVQPNLGRIPYTADDLTPILRLVSTQNVLVVKSDAPWKTIDEWLTYVKANPGKFTYSLPGTGIVPHLNIEAANLKAGLQTKGVAFDGTAPALTALLGGHVQGAVVQATEAKPYTDSGDIRVLASFGKTESYPSAPTFKDKGIDVNMELWTGIMGPKNLPVEIRDILHDAFKKALEDPKVIETLKKQGTSGAYAGPDEFKKLIDADSKSAAEILKAIGLVK